MAEQDWFDKDFYKMLGVSEKADEKEIRKAYRKLARELHPDKNPGNAEAENKFKEIGEAFAVLSDKEQRERYDTIRKMAAGGARFAPPPGGGGGFEDMFGGGISSTAGSSGVAEKNLNRITVGVLSIWAVAIVAYGLMIRFGF